MEQWPSYRVVIKNRVTNLLAFRWKHISDNSEQKPLRNADIFMRAGCMKCGEKNIRTFEIIVKYMAVKKKKKNLQK